jgi:hypothetical protein
VRLYQPQMPSISALKSQFVRTYFFDV